MAGSPLPIYSAFVRLNLLYGVSSRHTYALKHLAQLTRPKQSTPTPHHHPMEHGDHQTAHHRRTHTHTHILPPRPDVAESGRPLNRLSAPTPAHQNALGGVLGAASRRIRKGACGGEDGGTKEYTDIHAAADTRGPAEEGTGCVSKRGRAEQTEVVSRRILKGGQEESARGLVGIVDCVRERRGGCGRIVSGKGGEDVASAVDGSEMNRGVSEGGEGRRYKDKMVLERSGERGGVRRGESKEEGSSGQRVEGEKLREVDWKRTWRAVITQWAR
eukprot:GHVQ01020617.1.p1 GENE.GHVQ01020617.1~~GHVQ01020617.1.p1  ORF type:complete len:273 (+),score=70.97 GHVQ01020617.1:1476-2294(+)